MKLVCLFPKKFSKSEISFFSCQSRKLELSIDGLFIYGSLRDATVSRKAANVFLKNWSKLYPERPFEFHLYRLGIKEKNVQNSFGKYWKSILFVRNYCFCWSYLPPPPLQTSVVPSSTIWSGPNPHLSFGAQKTFFGQTLLVGNQTIKNWSCGLKKQ